MQRYLLTCNCSEQERNRLKEGEQPVNDQEADEQLGEAAKGVAETLIQVGTAVYYILIFPSLDIIESHLHFF